MCTAPRAGGRTESPLAAAIGRAAPRRGEHGHVVVLARIEHGEAYRDLLDEGRIRQRNPLASEVVVYVEEELVVADLRVFRLEDHFIRAPFSVGAHRLDESPPVALL